MRDALDAAGGGPHLHRHRAPAFHHSARRPDSRDAQSAIARDRARTRNCWRSAEFTGSCTSCNTRIRKLSGRQELGHSNRSWHWRQASALCRALRRPEGSLQAGGAAQHFFFVLAVSVYLSVIPVFSKHIAAARQRELKMIAQIFAAELPLNWRSRIAASRASTTSCAGLGRRTESVAGRPAVSG